MFFNKYKNFEGARVIFKKNHPCKFLRGYQGKIVKIRNAKEAEVRVSVIEYDEENDRELGQYVVKTQLKHIFLEEPEEYPTLPHLPVELKKRGGGNIMGKMPRLFQFFVYFAFVVLVWHIVTNVDTIAQFFVHLILHR